MLPLNAANGVKITSPARQTLKQSARHRTDAQNDELLAFMLPCREKDSKKASNLSSKATGKKCEWAGVRG